MAWWWRNSRSQWVPTPLAGVEPRLITRGWQTQAYYFVRCAVSSGDEPALHPGKRGGDEDPRQLPSLVINLRSTPASGVGTNPRSTPASGVGTKSGDEPALHPGKRGG